MIWATAIIRDANSEQPGKLYLVYWLNFFPAFGQDALIHAPVTFAVHCSHITLICFCFGPVLFL